MTNRVPPQNACEVLLRAAEILDERGWCQGSYLHCDTGEVCAIGAIHAAVRGVVYKSHRGHVEYGFGPTNYCGSVIDPLVLSAMSKLEEHMFGKYDGGHNIVNWNDGPLSTKEELQKALRAAAGVK